MRVLVACEYSGRVRDAFRARGHDAMSCDLLPCERPSPFHIQGDVSMVLADGWDLMIAHPPCTVLTNAGARWWKGREAEQVKALDFVRLLMDAPIARIAIENPPGKIGSAIRPADQYIQPHQFGHLETKKTGLWLKGLQKLRPTKDVHAEMMQLTLAERSRVHWMSPGPDRWKERSRTYQGIADAMADQWGGGCAYQVDSVMKISFDRVDRTRAIVLTQHEIDAISTAIGRDATEELVILSACLFDARTVGQLMRSLTAILALVRLPTAMA